jgi:voltage-gated sodium channel type XI alpha
VLTIIGEVFALIFIIEAILKIIAKGFILNKQSYLRDPWNVVDFIIAITR